MDGSSDDARFMREALELAARGLGRTAPNPPVGCVIVAGGEVIGRGFHPRAGEPHAEVFALREAGEQARGATAYVTLEPCSHHGRTPPCSNALVQAGVARVVVAALDPNPRVAGQGAERLRAAGVRVDVGVLEDEAVHQQAGFRSLVTRGRPWVVYKFAATLDGKVAAPGGDSRWVTGDAARALVHRWRDELDAVAVGSGTLLADDPRLNTRGVPDGRDARAVIFDRRARTPATAAALREGTIVVVGPDADAAHLEGAGASLVRAETLPQALDGLGALGVSSVLLEGGPLLAGAFVQADLIDEVRAFVAPKLLGAGLTPLAAPLRARMDEARDLHGVRVEMVGQDVLVRGLLHDIPALRAARREETVTAHDG